MDAAAILWFLLMLGFLFIEATTVALVSVWFSVGALVSMVASLLGAEVWVQIVLFLAVSGGLLAALRPIFRKFIKPRIAKTNLDAVIGSVGIVTTRIDNVQSAGQIKLGAMEWTARSTSGEVIPEGTQVKVDRIEGVKVYVTPVPVPVNTI